MISTVADLLAELQLLNGDAPVFFFDGETFQIELQKATHRSYNGYHVWIQKRFNADEARATVITRIEESKRDIAALQERLGKDRGRLKELIEYKISLESIVRKADQSR